MPKVTRMEINRIINEIENERALRQSLPLIGSSAEFWESFDRELALHEELMRKISRRRKSDGET